MYRRSCSAQDDQADRFTALEVCGLVALAAVVCFVLWPGTHTALGGALVAVGTRFLLESTVRAGLT